jgi:hypothetical protein
MRLSPGSARVSRVGDRVLAIADFFRKDCFGEPPKVRVGLTLARERRVRYPAACAPRSRCAQGATRKRSGLITVSFKVIENNRQSGSDRGF